MEITAKDAEQALNEAARTERKTHVYTSLKGSDWVSFLWGAIWVIGFSLQHVLQGRDFTLRLGRMSVAGAGIFWFPLVILGMTLGGLIMARSAATQSERERELGKAIGFMWFSLYLFAGFWMALIIAGAGGPLFTGEAGARIVTAIYVTIPMFALLLMGLFGCGRFLIVESIFITVMTGVGLLVTGEWFYLYMAIVGGGTQLAAGAWVKVTLSRASHE
jgi:hypothetical protein